MTSDTSGRAEPCVVLRLRSNRAVIQRTEQRSERQGHQQEVRGVLYGATYAPECRHRRSSYQVERCPLPVPLKEA